MNVLKYYLVNGVKTYSDLCNSEPFKCSVTTRIKLIAAIKSMPGSTASQIQPSQNVSLLGRQETRILAKLYQQADKISNKVGQLETAINGTSYFYHQCK